MSDEKKFCYHCGANLPQGSVYCPECGSPVDDSEPQRAEYTAQPVNQGPSTSSGAVPVLILIYGIISIIGGLLVILFGMSIDSIMDMMKEAYEAGTISEADYNNIINALKAINMMACTIIGVIQISSGILAVIAGSWSNNLKNWKNSVILCGVAAILPAFTFPFDPVTAVILPVVGLIMTYLIYQMRDKFTS